MLRILQPHCNTMAKREARLKLVYNFTLDVQEDRCQWFCLYIFAINLHAIIIIRVETGKDWERHGESERESTNDGPEIRKGSRKKQVGE